MITMGVDFPWTFFHVQQQVIVTSSTGRKIVRLCLRRLSWDESVEDEINPHAFAKGKKSVLLVACLAISLVSTKAVSMAVSDRHYECDYELVVGLEERAEALEIAVDEVRLT